MVGYGSTGLPECGPTESSAPETCSYCRSDRIVAVIVGWQGDFSSPNMMPRGANLSDGSKHGYCQFSKRFRQKIPDWKISHRLSKMQASLGIIKAQ